MVEKLHTLTGVKGFAQQQKVQFLLRMSRRNKACNVIWEKNNLFCILLYMRERISHLTHSPYLLVSHPAPLQPLFGFLNLVSFFWFVVLVST